MITDEHPKILHQFFDKTTDVNDIVFDCRPCVRVKQIHSAKCIWVDKPFGPDQWVEADALVTDQINLPIGIITADCGPVLLSGQNRDGAYVIGAAHAGWCGALNGVLEETIVKMDCDVSTIKAYIGPAIAKESYEVSTGFEDDFVKEDPRAMDYFAVKNDEKLWFDVKGYCDFRLQRAGVQSVDISPIDTLMNTAYCSYRGGANRKGRNLSAIMIAG